jgi:hypothetical protein
MNRRISFRVGASIAALAFGTLFITPVRVYAQSQGAERRDERQGAQDTRQQGRDAAQDAKEECRDAGGKLIDCRQQKQDVKQGARQDAQDIKKDQ